MRMINFRNLAGLWFFILVLHTSPVIAASNDCRPEGMSDAEAARIIEIATEQGKAFRTAIDKMRADGVSYEIDTTYEELMADPERAIALAKERHEGRISSQYNYSPKNLIAMGAEVEGYLERNIHHWVKKANHNFFTIELTNHLKQLAVLLGGEPASSPYRYSLNAKTFIFALGYFTETAELKYIRGSSADRSKYVSIQYKFSENWALWGRKSNYRISIRLTTDPSGAAVTLDYLAFGPVDMVKSPWPIFEPRNEGCLATHKQMEE